MFHHGALCLCFQSSYKSVLPIHLFHSNILHNKPARIFLLHYNCSLVTSPTPLLDTTLTTTFLTSSISFLIFQNILTSTLVKSHEIMLLSDHYSSRSITPYLPYLYFTLISTYPGRIGSHRSMPQNRCYSTLFILRSSSIIHLASVLN